MNTPRQVVTAAFDALRANDWKGLASLCDPLSLDAFRLEMLEEFGDQFGDPDPDASTSTLGPIELDDEHYLESMEHLHPDSRMKVVFPKLSTMDELRQLEPVEAFASWLEAQGSPREEVEDSREEPWTKESHSVTETDSSAPRGVGLRYAIIGCVFDSMDIAYVIYRPAVFPPERYAEFYENWLSKAPAEYRDFMIAMHHRAIPTLIICRRQNDGSWALIANRRFMHFGSLQVLEIRRDS